jgi:precorrin-6B methylase 2
MQESVKQYILVKGNREAAEILEDYVKYLHNLGYVIRRQSTLRRRANALRRSRQKHTVHLQPSVTIHSAVRHTQS